MYAVTVHPTQGLFVGGLQAGLRRWDEAGTAWVTVTGFTTGTTIGLISNGINVYAAGSYSAGKTVAVANSTGTYNIDQAVSPPPSGTNNAAYQLIIGPEVSPTTNDTTLRSHAAPRPC